MTVGIFATGGPFRSVMGISQLKGDFASGFVAHFVAAKWAFEVENGTRVLGSGFTTGGLGLRNYALGGFVAHFEAAKWALGLRNGTCVP